MSQTKPPKLTKEQAVNAVKAAGGSLRCNVLKYRPWRGVDGCFEAARCGLLIKRRISCAIYEFSLLRPQTPSGAVDA